jgi:hypothetical protein
VIIVLIVHAPADDRSDSINDNIYKKLDHALNQFCKYRMEILLGHFNTN